MPAAHCTNIMQRADGGCGDGPRHRILDRDRWRRDGAAVGTRRREPSGSVETADAVIVGGGMVGLTLGAALAGAGLRATVIDTVDPAATVEPDYDGRTSAIAPGSQRVLAGAGVWDGIAARACPIHDIRVSDGDAPLFLHYDHREAGLGPMGWIVENRDIRRALVARAARLETLRLRAPARLTRLERGRHLVTAHLADGGAVRAPLVLACDGHNSTVRRRAGIAAAEWRYPQTGIVCTVAHERPHRNVAHERFLPAGPFAILPMVDDERGRHRSSIVWTEREKLAPSILGLDRHGFAAELAARFGNFLGALEVVGRRWAYPLGLLHAERYIDRRLALVGDAAHAIHPIAGQGLNMGLRDVAALAEVLVDARRLGLDPGGAEVLARYQRWRRFDNTVLMFVTDGLNRLFSNDLAPVRLARDLGLAAVDAVPPLKRLFMRHAMGLMGDLPRLARGEAL